MDKEVMNMVQAINNALSLLMEKDESIIVLGEDVGVNGGVFRVTEGLIDKFGPERVIDTPLSESGIIGASIGMAINGLRPIPEIQFSGFIYPAIDQIISHLSRIRTRSRGKYSCPVTIRSPYSGGVRAPEHHSESMEAIYMHIPGLKVVIPSGPYDAKGLLISSVRDNDPVIFLEPKKIYRAFKEEVPLRDYEIPLGKAKIERFGQELTLISYGSMFYLCKKVIENNDYDAELIDLRSIYPMDTDTIVKSVKKTGRVVIVHEGPKTGGVAAEIIARINEKALLYLEAPVERVCGFDTIMPLYKLEDLYLPNEKRIELAIEKVLNF